MSVNMLVLFAQSRRGCHVNLNLFIENICYICLRLYLAFSLLVFDIVLLPFYFSETSVVILIYIGCFAVSHIPILDN